MTEPEILESPGRLAAAACHAPLRAAWATLERGCAERFGSALQEGIERHRAAVEASGLDGPAPGEWKARADALVAYRREVGSALLEPLLEVIAKRSPTSEIVAAVRQAVVDAAETAAALPESVPAAWPEDALARRPDERLGRRLRKAVARVLSPARKAGAPRSLPLRAVARRHLCERAIPATDTLAEHTLTTWLEWEGALEAAWLRWGDVALPALVRAEQPSDEVPSEIWTAIAAAAKALQEDLTALAETIPARDAEAEANARFDELRGSLEADLAVAGSMVYDPSDWSAAVPGMDRLLRRERAASAWEEGVGARLRVFMAILSVLAGATAVQRRLGWRFREHCIAPLGGLPAVADEVDGLVRSLPADSIGPDRLAELDEEVARTIRPALEAVPERRVVASTVSEGSDAAVEALFAMVRQAPSSLALHGEHTEPPRGNRPVDTRTLAFQELARQSFDAMRIERIRSSTLGLIEAVEQVRVSLDELPDVFSFARDEAQRELDEAEEDAEARARALVGEALGSIAESMRGQLRTLETAATEAEQRLALEVSAGSSALLDRVAAGRMQARLLAARSRVSELRAWINDVWGPPVDRALRVATTWARRLRRLLGRGLRRGSEIVAGPSASDSETGSVIHRLAVGLEGLEDLPLVYQRLFTLEPLTDAALLAGRDAELQRALTRWARWHDDEGIPLIVRGRPGSGITSFLNVLGSRIEDDGGSVVRVALTERVHGEAELAEVLAKALSLPCVPSLDGLAEVLFDASSSELPAVVSLDNLEHLYLRVPGGTDLVERVLTLMAETEPKIFWIGGVTTSAWQLISSSEPSAVSQVDQFELGTLGPQPLRQAVETRHRRSGLPVRFEEPAAGRRLLRRRLNRIRDPGAYQDALASDFFDQLHRSSSSHLPLALFQWLLAADFEGGDGLTMSPPRKPDFSLLDLLDLEQNFTLKAFLEHRTLSLGEHGRIFRTPRQRSYQIFESLRNRSLIEVVDGTGSAEATRSEIDEELRYRVPQLLTGALLAHLTARNIVH